MKKITKRDASIGPFIREQEKDPEMKAPMDRAGLRSEIARAIKAARERAGLTQAELRRSLVKRKSRSAVLRA